MIRLPCSVSVCFLRRFGAASAVRGLRPRRKPCSHPPLLGARLSAARRRLRGSRGIPAIPRTLGTASAGAKRNGSGVKEFAPLPPSLSLAAAGKPDSERCVPCPPAQGSWPTDPQHGYGLCNKALLQPESCEEVLLKECPILVCLGYYCGKAKWEFVSA